MRGKPPSSRCLRRGLRNIPAYAGKTPAPAGRNRRNQEHPRVCGENPRPPISPGYPPGTSPRMRGKLGNHGDGHGRMRNIPAYAGKTLGNRCSHGGYPEHPRVCGENGLRPWRRYAPPGTSPRMRGKLLICEESCTQPGNIPAYAGKTGGGSRRDPLRWEHPRVCGENIGHHP